MVTHDSIAIQCFPPHVTVVQYDRCPMCSRARMKPAPTYVRYTKLIIASMYTMRSHPIFTVGKQRLHTYWRLMRFDKPIGIFLLLWPGLWALWIAGEGHPYPFAVCVIVLGTVLMRAAGCVINDYADRDFDPHVERTRTRPIATGEVSPREALSLFVGLCLIAFTLVLFTNPLTIVLSIPGAFLAASYPFTKRYTHLPQAYLGLAFGWAIPMAFSVQTGQIPSIAWELYVAAIVWALVYDTLYAMVDRDDDLKIGIKSTAILFGQWDRAIIGLLQGILVLTLAHIGQQIHLGTLYGIALGIATALSIQQQWAIQHREKEKCFQAFLDSHWLGAAVFLGIFLEYLTKTA